MAETKQFDLTEFDKFLDPKGPVILVGKQLLKLASVDGEKSEIVFPPSYANPSGRTDDPPVYNIDELDVSDPTKNVCVLDSIPSQANRMEPIFNNPPYDQFIPQYSVKFGDELPVVSITQFGHRIADAAFRGTSLRPAIVGAFKAYAKGCAKELAEIAPTSLVFGAWDSRGTGVKIPRLINSIIRAFNVAPLKRSAQYSPPIKYEQEGLIPDGLAGKPADHGLADVPSPHAIGGLQVRGDIRRDFSLNLELLRQLKSSNDDETRNLQLYILALALLAFTASQESTLRQGCQLLLKSKPIWKQFHADGTETDWSPDGVDFFALASAAVTRFNVRQPTGQPLVFDKKKLKQSIESDKKTKSRKQTKTKQSIESHADSTEENAQ